MAPKHPLLSLADQVDNLDPDEDDPDVDANEEDDEPKPKPETDSAKAEASFRKRISELTKRKNSLIAENKALKASKSTATDADAEKDLRKQVQAEVAVKFGRKLAVSQAAALLTAAGYKGNAARGAKLLASDIDDLVDEDGEVDTEALNDAIADWKSDEPNLFPRSRDKASEDEDDEDDEPRPRQRRSASGNPELGKRKSSGRRVIDPLEAALTALVNK